MAKADNNYIEKASVYGKALLNVGDNTSTICLNTVGTVMVKTPGRYITIFKDGKLCVDSDRAISTVGSEDEMTSDGIYILTGEDGNNSVYVKSGELTLLVYDDANGYVSYTSVQNLTAGQFALALSNIGLYFDTLDAAKAAGISDGLVYVTGTGTVYSVSGGVFTDVISEAADEALERFGEQGYDTLHVGAIFIDGKNNLVNSESGLTFQIDGYDYVVLRNNTVFVRKNIVIGSGVDVSTEGAVKGRNGLLVYKDSDGITLEVDSLIVHNSEETQTYEPQMYSEYVSSDTYNLITDAAWDDAPGRIQLDLKYDNAFETGDSVFVCISAGLNMAHIEWFTDDDGKVWMAVYLDSAPSVTTTVRVTYNVRTGSDGDELEERTVDVTIDPDDVDPEDDNPEPNAHGQAEIPDEYIDSVVSLSVLSGDTNIRYDDGETSYTQSMPGVSVATVISTDPLVIETANTDSSQNILDNLAWSPIVRRNSSDETGHYISSGNGNIELYETDGDSANVIASFGRHFDEYGIFARHLEAYEAYVGSVYAGTVSAEAIDSISASINELEATSLTLLDWARCSDSMVVPSDPLSDEYDSIVPNVSWVKEIVRQMLQQ